MHRLFFGGMIPGGTFYNTPGDGAGGGGGTPGAGEGTPQQQPHPDGGGQPNGQPGAGGAEGGKPKETVYSFKEDRSDWVPRTRLNEISTKAQREATDLRQKLELAEKRTKLAFGIEVPDAATAEQEEIKSAILKMFPHLGETEGLTKDAIAEIRRAAQVAQATTDAQWRRHATAAMSECESQIQNKLGVKELTATQKRQIQMAFRSEAAAALDARPEDENGEKVDPTGNDFLSRYERGDKALYSEFVTAFLNDWFEPVKRSVTAQQQRNFRPTPKGGRGQQILAAGEPQVNLNNDKEFKQALLAARGGER